MRRSFLSAQPRSLQSIHREYCQPRRDRVFTSESVRAIHAILVTCTVWLSAVPALAKGPDTGETVRVFQPKLFFRPGRLDLSPRLGISLNDPYIQHFLTGLSATYHISDLFAVGAVFDHAFSATTIVTDEILDRLNVRTALSPIQFIASAQFDYSPIYGKFSIANRAIAHWDLSAGLGIGAVSTKATGLHPSVSIGISLRTYLSRWLAVAFDLRDHIFGETISIGGQSSGGLTHTLMFVVKLSIFVPIESPTE